MIIGGFSDGHPTNAVYTFDLKTRKVESIASLNKNRYSHSSTSFFMDGQEYVFAAGNTLSWFLKIIISQLCFPEALILGLNFFVSRLASLEAAKKLIQTDNNNSLKIRKLKFHFLLGI